MSLPIAELLDKAFEGLLQSKLFYESVFLTDAKRHMYHTLWKWTFRVQQMKGSRSSYTGTADGTGEGQGWDQTPAENEKWEGRKLMGFAFITGPALGKIDTHC